MDDSPVEDGRLTMMRITMLKPGDRISVTVVSDRESFEMEAVISALNESPG